MSLLNQIKDDALQARVNRDTLRSNLLNTLYAEATKANKEASDEEVTAVIRKFVKNINETITALIDVDATGARIEAATQERSILENYLPEQISDARLRSLIENAVASLPEKNMKQMGAVMSILNKNYAGMFDRAVAANIIKELLSS